VLWSATLETVERADVGLVRAAGVFAKKGKRGLPAAGRLCSVMGRMGRIQPMV
jgi:hypothetical protein